MPLNILRARTAAPTESVRVLRVTPPELQRRICWPWGLWGGAMTSTRSSGKAGVGCEPVCSPDAPFEACLSSLWHFNLSSFPRVSL